MKNVAGALERYMLKKEEVPSTATHVVVGLLFVAMLRLGLEQLPNPQIQKYFLLTDFNNILAFYTATFFLFLWFVSFFFPREIPHVRSVVLFGIFGGLIPPLLTHILPHGAYIPYDYFHEFRWNFIAPYEPLGESVGLWLIIGFVGLYFWFKKRNFFITLAGMIGTYVLLQCTAWLLLIPANYLDQILNTAWANPMFLPFATDFMLLAIAFIAFVGTHFKSFKATLRKFHHSIMRGVLVIFGAQIAGTANWESLFVATVFVLAYVFIQAENDFFDKEIDRVTHRESAITADDLIYVRFFMALLVLTIYMVEPALSMLLGLFFLFGFIYNHPAFRFKKDFVKASFVEGSLALIAILAGIFTIPKPGVMSAELWIAIAVSVLFAIISNIRDFKDFEGDRKEGVKTLYVMLDKRGIAPERTQRALIGIVSLSYAASLLIFYMLRMPSFILLTTAAFFVLSFIPFAFIEHKKKSLSSIITITGTGIALIFAAFYVLPLLQL